MANPAASYPHDIPFTAQQRATFWLDFFLIIYPYVLLVIGIICAILYMIVILVVVTPEDPSFSVETLTLTNFNISSNSIIYGNWDARFIVTNPDSIYTLYYDHIKADLYYKSNSISETSVPPFGQGTSNETVVRATFAPLMAYVDDRAGMIQEKNNGMVVFGVKIATTVRCKSHSWYALSSTKDLRVYCPNLSIGVPANSNGGSLVGGSKQCTVDNI